VGPKYLALLEKRRNGVNEAQTNGNLPDLGFPKKVLYCDLKICVWIQNDECRPFRFFFS
jgi:hypothetical protein